jgi:excinuclease UvrABC nuclease subunit
MARKTIGYTKGSTEKLPEGKPVVYKIQTESGKTNYVGIAKRGRVQERILEHLADDDIPGAKVQVQQVSSIQEAQQIEKRIIARTQPKYNDQGK